jgi:hypothetical protein
MSPPPDQTAYNIELNYILLAKNDTKNFSFDRFGKDVFALARAAAKAYIAQVSLSLKNDFW